MAATESFTLDGLALNDYSSGGVYGLRALQFTPARKRPDWSENTDGDGALLVRDPYFTNSQWDATVLIRAASRDAAHAAVGALTDKFEEAERNVLGIPLVWTPADSSDALTFYVLTGEITEIPITHESGYFASTPVLAVGLTLTCRPFGYGAEVGTLTDDFAVDTIGSGAWDVFFGSGNVSVSGGELVPSSVAEKRLRRTDLTVYDSEITVKHTTPSAFAATYIVGVILKWIDANNYLYARITENGAGSTVITVRKRDGGVDTNLATLTAPAALSTSTAYHLRARLEGDLVTVQHLDASKAALTGGGTHLLTGGNDTKFGEGVGGSPGLTWVPQANTSARLDDFTVTQNVYVKASGDVITQATIYGVEGDVDAEARLIVTDTAGQSRDFAAWGREYRWYNGSDLQLTQPDLTATGFAGTSTTRAGSVSTNIYRGTLTTSPVAVCGTGNQPHVGVYRVYARLWATGAGVRARLAYREGDGPLKALNWETPPAEDAWVELDLGVVSIPEKTLGTQRWQGQVEAYTDTPGDTLDVDYLLLIPAGAYGRARIPRTFQTANSFIARDEFDQSAGVLTGKTAPVGGVWAFGTGDTDDFTVETTGHTAQRATTSDTAMRFEILGTATPTDVAVQVNVKTTVASGPSLGVVARYTDANNHVTARWFPSDPTIRVEITTGGSLVASSHIAVPDFGVNNWVTIRLLVDSGGRWFVWADPVNGLSEAPIGAGQHTALATAGGLASGKSGMVDLNGGGTASTRSYDDFLVFVPAAEAVCFSGQSIEFRSDDTIREDSTGIYWGRPKEYRGAPFFIPPAGDEGRTSRVAVMLRRNDIYALPSTNPTDSQSVEVRYTPRRLYLPR